MYKIVPTERQERSGKTITKNRCKPSKNSLQRSFLAPPAGFEPVACRLGGDRSIQLSYGGLYRKYSILQRSRIRTIRFLGGGCSILLSYGRRYEILRKRGPSAGVEHPLRRRSLYTTEQRDINRPASAGHTSYCTRFAPGCQSKTKPPRQFAAAAREKPHSMTRTRMTFARFRTSSITAWSTLVPRSTIV